jgi:hypothetical protein
MNDTPKGPGVNCEWLLSELEALPMDEAIGGTAQVWMLRMPPDVRGHAAECANCRQSLEDFAETRSMLAQMDLPEAGPWFTRRVMNAIALKEAELEERVDGFWIGVRRLAPRLVAFATLILMLGGTWAFQEHRAHQSGQQARPAEGIFEATPSVQVNDDIVATANEVQQP